LYVKKYSAKFIFINWVQTRDGGAAVPEIKT